MTKTGPKAGKTAKGASSGQVLEETRVRMRAGKLQERTRQRYQILFIPNERVARVQDHKPRMMRCQSNNIQGGA